MELIIGAISTFATGAGAAGGAAAAGGGLLGALTGGSALSTVLSGGVTVLSALRALDAGKEKALDADMKASETRAKIVDEQAAGAKRRMGLKEEAYKVLGQNDVNTAAAGIDLSYGFGQQQRENTVSRLAQEVSIDSQTQADRVQQLSEREANYRRMARGARKSGTLSAALTLGEGAVKLAGRYG